MPALRQGDQVDGGLPAMLPAARQSQNMVHEVPRLRNQELSGRFIPPLSLSLSLFLSVSLSFSLKKKKHTHTHTHRTEPRPLFVCLFGVSSIRATNSDDSSINTLDFVTRSEHF